jgi:N-acetylneuraminic acid mutarotase
MKRTSSLRAGLVLGAILTACIVLMQCQFLAMLGLGGRNIDKNVYWKEKSPMPTPRGLLGIAAVNNRLYALGGVQADNQSYSTVEEYNPADNSWRTMAAMPTPRADFAVEVIGDKIYVVGGYNSGSDENYYLRSLEVFDPATNSWTAKTPMNSARSGLASGVVNGKLYVFGGNCDKNWESGCLYTVEEYDPATNAWTKKEPMPTPRADLIGAVVNDKIYAIGGSIYDNGEWYYFGNVEEYDPAANTWKAKTPMNTPRCDGAAAVAGGAIYVAGGICNVKNTKQSLSLNDVEVYYADKDKWIKKYPLPTVRYSLGLGLLQGKLYAVGGVVGSEYLGKVEEYTP